MARRLIRAACISNHRTQTNSIEKLPSGQLQVKMRNSKTGEVGEGASELEETCACTRVLWPTTSPISIPCPFLP